MRPRPHTRLFRTPSLYRLGRSFDDRSRKEYTSPSRLEKLWTRGLANVCFVLDGFPSSPPPPRPSSKTKQRTVGARSRQESSFRLVARRRSSSSFVVSRDEIWRIFESSRNRAIEESWLAALLRDSSQYITPVSRSLDYWC